MSVFIAMPKNAQTIAHTSYTSKLMLKTLQARLQQCLNRELPDVQAGFKKGSAQECSDYRTFALISHASRVMLKTLQAKL